MPASSRSAKRSKRKKAVSLPYMFLRPTKLSRVMRKFERTLIPSAAEIRNRIRDENARLKRRSRILTPPVAPEEMARNDAQWKQLIQRYAMERRPIPEVVPMPPDAGPGCRYRNIRIFECLTQVCATVEDRVPGQEWHHEGNGGFDQSLVYADGNWYPSANLYLLLASPSVWYGAALLWQSTGFDSPEPLRLLEVGMCVEQTDGWWEIHSENGLTHLQFNVRPRVWIYPTLGGPPSHSFSPGTITELHIVNESVREGIYRPLNGKWAHSVEGGGIWLAPHTRIHFAFSMDVAAAFADKWNYVSFGIGDLLLKPYAVYETCHQEYRRVTAVLKVVQLARPARLPPTFRPLKRPTPLPAP